MHTLNQCDSFRSEPILNESWTNLSGCFNQTSFITPTVVWIILILYNHIVDCLQFGLVQDWFSIHSYPYPFRINNACRAPRGVSYLFCTSDSALITAQNNTTSRRCTFLIGQLLSAKALTHAAWQFAIRPSLIHLLEIICPNKYQETTDIWSALEGLYANINPVFGKLEIGVEANAVGPYISEP